MDLQSLLDVLACPRCKGRLFLNARDFLCCASCQLAYPQREGIPDLTPESGLPILPDGRVVPQGTVATFQQGENSFYLESGSCRVIGRHLDDPSQTQIFHVDFTMALDEQSKKLIGNYLSRQTGKKKDKKNPDTATLFDEFKRLPDLILNDASVSRLHAMLFFDEMGVGVIDLLSRNGTRVNGREVETASLKPGDQLTLGAVNITFSTLK